MRSRFRGRTFHSPPVQAADALLRDALAVDALDAWRLAGTDEEPAGRWRVHFEAPARRFVATVERRRPQALVSCSPPKTWMQAVAAEMNLSETAFLVPRREGGAASGAASFDLRWFTPTTEVDLCGHATLAAAHRLWQGGGLAAGEEARFHTRSGLLTARRGGDGWIELDFPALPPQPAAAPPGLAAALGVEPRLGGAEPLRRFRRGRRRKHGARRYNRTSCGCARWTRAASC
jgi:hypothetical protein